MRSIRPDGDPASIGIRTQKFDFGLGLPVVLFGLERCRACAQPDKEWLRGAPPPTGLIMTTLLGWS